MMAARRVVVIRDLDVWRKKSGPREVLERYLTNPATETVLVLVERSPGDEKERNWAPDPALLGGSYGVLVERLPADRVPRWLAYHAQRLGVTFGEGAAEHLALAADYDLGALQSELEKFASLAAEGPISREQVGDLVGIRHGETVEDWVEAVITDDTTRAVGLGPRVLEQAGMSGVRMVTAVGAALLGLQLARALHDKGNRGGTLERALWERMRVVRPAGVPDPGRPRESKTRFGRRWTPTWRSREPGSARRLE
jgi:DNA polymerase III delta subunit